MSRIEGNEAIVKTLVTIFTNSLPTLIAEINDDVADDFILEPPVNVLPYIPFDLTLEQGMPIVAVQDLPATYENDLIHSFEGEYGLGIASILQTSDHQTLAWQLRRYNQAVMQAIQNDRLLGPAGLLASEAEVMYTEFVGMEPGPLLGDRDPDAEGLPPVSFRSWTWLLIKCRRQEVNG